MSIAHSFSNDFEANGLADCAAGYASCDMSFDDALDVLLNAENGDCNFDFKQDSPAVVHQAARRKRSIDGIYGILLQCNNTKAADDHQGPVNTAAATEEVQSNKKQCTRRPSFNTMLDTILKSVAMCEQTTTDPHPPTTPTPNLHIF
jgi:hypothetical protein